ncbi:MAG TPA: hypothetical protein VJA21_19250 [Verrucomicrobiae bacterium]
MEVKLDNVVTIVLMVLGVVLFFVALWVLKVLIKQKKPLTPAYGLFAFTVIMVGFSAITSITFPGGGGIDKHAKGVGKDPGDAKTVAALGEDLDKHLDAAKPTQLGPGTKAELANAVARLSARTNLSAESRVTLSKAQLVLGRTNEAAATLKSAVTANPRLSTDPKIRTLLRRVNE